LLSIVNIDFKHFACSDVKRFVLNIKDKAKAHEITNRVTKDGPAELQANLIQPMHGKFTRMAIAHCAKLINQSQSGVCTTLALAGADRLLKLFPNERIEIIAHEGGYQGTHVYIIMNHTGDSWKMNNLQAMRESGTDKAQASDELTKVFLQETDHAFIVDPWLASLGWDAGVFDILVFLNDKRLSNFLTSTVCFFDSNNEPKPKNRLV